MNKYFIIIACAILSLFSSCDEKFDVETMSNEDIAGTWYEPEYNEEVKFTESGRFYDKSCNMQMSSYIEGTYELTGNKLTRLYTLLGKVQTLNSKISNITSNSFTLKARESSVTVYRVAETIMMQPGETKELPGNEYTSPDSRIVSINGITIKAEGLKGVLYLKGADNSYIKVVVGDDVLDLWYDYTNVLGCSVNEMKNILGEPSRTENGIAYYTNMHNTHNIIDYVGLIINNDKVERIILVIKDGVDEIDITNYLGNKYFYSAKVGLYYSHKTQEESTFIAGYDSKQRYVIFEEKKDPFALPEFSNLFGITKDDLKSRQFFTEYGSVKTEGKDSIWYTLDNINGLEDAIFYFRGKGNLMNSFAVCHNETVSEGEVDDLLQTNFQYLGDTSLNGYTARMYSSTSNITVFYYPQRRRIEYYDLSQQEMGRVSAHIAILGMTKQELINNLGAGYEYNSYIVYGVNNDLFQDLYCRIDKNGNVDMYFYTLNDKIDINEINDALKEEYSYLSYDSDKKMSTWINSDKKETATIGINFYKTKRQLIFFDISK